MILVGNKSYLTLVISETYCQELSKDSPANQLVELLVLDIITDLQSSYLLVDTELDDAYVQIVQDLVSSNHLAGR